MNRIYKYPLAVDDVQEIEMPSGAMVLTVQAQDEIPCIWALVDTSPDLVKTKRRFRTYGTGHPMEDLEKFPRYVGTYQLRGGALVFHVFSNL